MRVAVIAEPDLRERMRAVRAVAGPGSVSAIGAGTWDELVQVLDEMPVVQLLVYSPPLPGEPAGALTWLAPRAQRIVVVSDEPAPSGSDGPTRVGRPISDEALTLLSRGVGAPSAAQQMSFAPADFLQMLVMSGNNAVVVVTNAEGADTGVIELRGGAVWTAFDALGVGEEAFARLVRPEMRARVSSNAALLPHERTITKQLSELLLDSLRRFDEGLVVRPPPLGVGLIEAALGAPEELASRVKELGARARRELLERKYDEAARTLTHLAALDPTSPLVRANLEQLRKLGYP